jgi:oligoribonuclease
MNVGARVAISDQNLIWIDCEMTGLNPEHDRIIEIATIITDSHLNILAEGPVMAVNQPQSLLDGMDAWNTKQHNQSGLVKRVQESKITDAIAEQRTLDFLKQYVPGGTSPMCGNSICQDRRFLYRYMPTLAEFFHYRNLDVSTLKELARRWAPKVYSSFEKDSTHLALADIKDSIAELVHYREHFIRHFDSESA